MPDTTATRTGVFSCTTCHMLARAAALPNGVMERLSRCGFPLNRAANRYHLQYFISSGPFILRKILLR